jgi:hypothetical protein
MCRQSVRSGGGWKAEVEEDFLTVACLNLTLLLHIVTSSPPPTLFSGSAARHAPVWLTSFSEGVTPRTQLGRFGGRWSITLATSLSSNGRCGEAISGKLVGCAEDVSATLWCLLRHLARIT